MSKEMSEVESEAPLSNAGDFNGEHAEYGSLEKAHLTKPEWLNGPGGPLVLRDRDGHFFVGTEPIADAGSGEGLTLEGAEALLTALTKAVVDSGGGQAFIPSMRSLVDLDATVADFRGFSLTTKAYDIWMKRLPRLFDVAADSTEPTAVRTAVMEVTRRVLMREPLWSSAGAPTAQPADQRDHVDAEQRSAGARLLDEMGPIPPRQFPEIDATVAVTIRVTSLGAPGRGPSHDCAGEPAEPPAWEIVGVDEDEINQAVAEFVAELREREAEG